MIKHILFDLDGVLFGDISGGRDYHDALFIKAINTILPDIKITQEYHDSKLQGMTTVNKLKFLRISEDDSKRIISLKKELITDYITNHLVPNESQMNMCKQLTMLKYTLYCVSNSDRSVIEMCLKGLNIIEYFSGFIGKEDVKENKPNPEPYLRAYSRFNLNPTDSLVIEDSVSGIASAKASGGNVLEVSGTRDVSFAKILKAIDTINIL
jgi:HAD superfamily hydrolase (TIGR01509 family)